jgi:hypothetical protein
VTDIHWSNHSTSDGAAKVPALHLIAIPRS